MGHARDAALIAEAATLRVSPGPTVAYVSQGSSKAMRILFLTPELPNQFHRIRALNLLRGLSRHHEVDVVSLTHRPPRPEEVEALRPLCRRVDWVVQPLGRSLVQCAVGLLRPAPLEAWYEWSPRLARRLQRRLAERSYDVLYVKRLRMAEYGLEVHGLPRILDVTDSMERFYDLARRRAPLKTKALFWEEWVKHRWYERRVAAQFDRCVVCSPVDAAYLREHSGLRNVEVVPNAVDTEHFQARLRAEEPATFLLSGLMDKLVNVDAALYLTEEIWPLVRSEAPAARLRLVGPEPAAAVRRLDGQEGVEVVGEVPDLREEIARATATVVPLRVGTGTKNKILQSLAMARPVVTTSVGNEGLDAVSGQHLLLADDPVTFAASLVRLLNDAALRAGLGAAGRDWVAERFSVATVSRRLEEVLASVVAPGADRRSPAAAGPGSGPP